MGYNYEDLKTKDSSNLNEIWELFIKTKNSYKEIKSTLSKI